MPVASNPLLQAGAPAKPSRAPASQLDALSQGAKDKSPGFSKVYAQQSRGPEPATAASGKDKQAAIADSGKDLPEDKDDAVEAPASGADATALDPKLVAGQVTDAQPGSQLIQAQAEAVAPVVQAAQLQAQVGTVPEVAEELPFDPEADPLADMPALRMALEQSAQAQGTTSTHAAGKATQADASAQPVANTLATLVEEAGADGGQSEPGDKAFAALLDDGLKDLKSTASDTRVDNFAERLSALTQAVTAKSANPTVPAAPLHQPLAMNQGGWTEGLVNRVMYLSSQNLKSADIQLEPAELGRLDIRVHLAPEQQAQITFTSGHVGVREALENQVHRLKEMFAQQGLGQPDVNVADQSRGQQQQGSADTPRLSGVAARRNEAAEAAAPVEQQVVLGSSEVDYYA
ncbi:flagellar hook-length control protein FliK [Pseudomonas sp. GD03860]|uniref:flagellar hook-length control protein FliK n=1 Tax=Pseudomonas TaxID=286 RepID=UPI0023642C1B|nr:MULTISPECIES: flagellar hook-length control protein FliK [Pseudomonas]MDD2060768.1 flagellar hook-length control protein FliK [Pseudomonas putida]MDH0638250.1 flagellar hook-length control protein FliK [Pseudomonas sp. GD03860]